MGLLKLVTIPTTRDYSLTGRETEAAREAGLVNAEWYQTPVDRKTMKALMKREDGPAIRDTAIWIALFAVSAAGGIAFWGSWAAVPFWMLYGVLYGTSSDSRWHETLHGTAFKTRWMNDALYQVASFMMLRNPVVWRWSHTRHHTDTIIAGRDPEISGMRPPQLIMMGLNVFGLISVPQALAALVRQAGGRLTADEADLVPESEVPKAVRAARIHVGIYAATLVACLLSGSIIPAMLIGLPAFYGRWLLPLYGLPQHLGLAENVLDHRLNSRTVLMSRPLRFLYWNMNYHMEHHMFPMVPYHRLPELHEAVKHDCPAPSPSLWAAWREILPCVWRQLRDPSHFLVQELPPGAGRARPGPMAAE